MHLRIFQIDNMDNMYINWFVGPFVCLVEKFCQRHPKQATSLNTKVSLGVFASWDEKSIWMLSVIFFVTQNATQGIVGCTPAQRTSVINPYISPIARG